ncbi:MAG: outer membrane beta-barrel protein [Bacteroidetes bacterium]|nr:outer membrane beta-barrel protein [Bacteroidota bacterium]
MMKVIKGKWLFIFVLIYTVSSAQETKTGIWKHVDPGVNIGLNYSKFKTDSFNMEYGSMPLIGLYAKKDLAPRFDTRLGFNFSMRNSKVSSPYVKYKYKYLDTEIDLGYRLIDPVRLELGVQAEFILEALFQEGSNPNNSYILPVEKFKKEFEVFAGLHVDVQNDISLGFRYYYPLNDVSFSNLQFLLSIPIRQNPFEKRVNKEEQLADKQIVELHEGALLVRLKTYQQIIQSLKKDGRHSEAESMEYKRDEENREIMASFKKYYTFSPVYFFYSYDSEKVRAGLLENIFLNESFQVDSSISCESKNIYLAEIASLQADDVGKTSTGIESLLILDNQFVQLKRPFPFYVKRDEFFLGSRTIPEMVGIMNFNLHEYLKGTISE